MRANIAAGWKRAAAVGVIAAGVGVTAGRAVTQPPAAPPATEPTLVPPTTPDYGSRPVAYIYGTTPVTRADLAEFLIARGGHDRVDVLVNKMIVEVEAKKRGLTVTPQEMEAALGEDLKGINVDKKDFVGVVLPKYGKTLFEWMEDVVRPRLLLTKMCKDKVKVEEDDLKKEFERQFGEKRDVRVIIWPATDDKQSIFKLWAEVRKSDDEFLRVARNQANPALAATAGHIKPVSKHLTAEDKVVETTAFGMREGDVSQVLETRQGFMVMKLLRVIPSDVNVKYETTRDKLHAEVFDLKLTAEIPKQFAELQKAANPTILLKGPPAPWRFDQSNRQMAETMRPAAVTPAAGTATPPPTVNK